MSLNTESEDDKRIRLGEEMVKLSIDIAGSEGRKIPHFTLDEKGIFYEKLSADNLIKET
jgi:hypothetical protein